MADRAPDPRRIEGRPRLGFVAAVCAVIVLVAGVIAFFVVRSLSEEVPTAPLPTPTRSPVVATTPATLPDVTVYWTQVPGGGLYREERTVRDRGDRLTSAVRAMMELTPLDKDHGTMWRGPDSIFTRQIATGIAVDVSRNVFGARGPFTPAQVDAALQQLAWTATSAAGKDLPVTVLVDGETGFPAWGVTTLDGPIRRSSDALAPIWVTSPTEGALLPAGKPIVVTGESRTLEGALTWSLATARPAGVAVRPVATGTLTGGADSRRRFRFEIPAPGPGDYVITVAEPDQSDADSSENLLRIPDDTRLVTIAPSPS